MTKEKDPSIQNIAAVVLAAGGSTRMGQPKLLLPWKGEPLIRWPVKTALEAGLSPVIVITGATANEIESALDGLPVKIVNNPDWAEGQSTSLRCGIAALPETAEGVILFLGDQPQIPGDVIPKMIAEYRSKSPAVSIFISSYRGKRGNPVLFDRTLFTELRSLEGDAGGRLIFTKHPVQYITVDDAGVLLDIDSPEDYQNLVERVEK